MKRKNEDYIPASLTEDQFNRFMVQQYSIATQQNNAQQAKADMACFVDAQTYYSGQALNGMIAGSQGLVISMEEIVERSLAFGKAMVEPTS